MNWHKEYAAIYLKIPKLVTRAALPSRTTFITQDILGFLEVKGDATDDSASDKEIPVWAARRAPQSLAPSPHIARNKNNLF